MAAILSARPKCPHRCASLKTSLVKVVPILTWVQKGISPELRATWLSREKKKVPFLGIFCIFFRVWGQKGQGKKNKKTTRARPWYARKSGKSPGQWVSKIWTLMGTLLVRVSSRHSTPGCPREKIPIFGLRESWKLPSSQKQLQVPRAQHINFGHSHPPRKIIQNARSGSPE